MNMKRDRKLENTYFEISEKNNAQRQNYLISYTSFLWAFYVCTLYIRFYTRKDKKEKIVQNSRNLLIYQFYVNVILIEK